MQLTTNFSAQELQCPCCHKCEMDKEFLMRLQLLRVRVGRSMGINSGYRCLAHNQSVGGRPSSRHLIGIAVDVSTVDWSSSDLYNLIKEAQRLHFRGIGVAQTYVHLDTREDRAKMWVY